MAARGDAYDSSSSASSDDAVLITSKHRKKLQKPPALPPVPAPLPPVTPTPATPAKPDHICGVCEREGGALLVCTGSCVSAFHAACLAVDSAPPVGDAWKCPSCVAGTHVCFHCKQKGFVASDTTESNEDAAMRPVVKCRALSCGKFYHQDCIAKLPLARIAGARFICPLHTCAACEQSGAKKEPVRCTRCPVAYHTSCLPRNGVVPLPGKRIICPKHDGAPPPQVVDETHATQQVEDGEVEEGEEMDEVDETKQMPALRRVATDDHDTAASVAASSPRTEENDDDARSDTSATGASAGKKHSKSSKKDKKKKKKKKKKDKKKDKERSKSDDASEKEDGAKKSDKHKRLSSSSTPKSSSVKHESRSDEERGGDGEHAAAEMDDKSAGTILEHDGGGEETAARAAEELLVKVEQEPLPLASPPTEAREQHESIDTMTAPASADDSQETDTTNPTTKPAEVKLERERDDHREVVQEQSDDRVVSEEVKLQSPIPAAAEREVAETDPNSVSNQAEESRRKDELDSAEASSRVLTEHASPVKNDHHLEAAGHEVYDEKHEQLTVKIPEVSNSVDGDDGDDSGSGSGSQSTKARSRSAADDSVRERSGGSSRSKKSKKKKKGGKGEDIMKHGPGGDEEAGEAPRDEAKWVQCDDCKKWRTVAKEIDLDAMPETWYCKMNTWNKAVASCDVPEEVVETKKSKPTKRSSGAIGEVVTPVPKKAKLSKQVGVVDPPAPEEVDTSATEKDKGAAGKVVKKADKDSKKRKLKLKLKEKYGEVNWVQCENKQCGKWRVAPSRANPLPSVWYCNLNTWEPELANCSAPNPPEVEAYLSKSQSKKPSGTRPAKRQRGPDNGQEQTAVAPAAVQSDGKPANTKPSKGGAKTATPTAHGAGAAGSSRSGGAGNSAGAVHQVGGVDDGRGAKALVGVKSVVLEWAQCEKCLKWRKLPAHIKSSTLPDKWYCSMNHWDTAKASCAYPQEEDQEPIDASPLPSSQNWYPMPGQVGGTGSTGGSVRPQKRGKLSYSELLYASTGQLRKTYTSDSSTLSFEYEGVMYHRDDQYKKSSMYVSPLTTNKLTGEQIDPQSDVFKIKDTVVQFVPPATQQLVDQISKVILSKIDLRRDFAITDIIDSVLNDSDVTGDLSLSVITSAIAQLVSCGELERVDRNSQSHLMRASPVSSSATSLLLGSLSSQPAYYRKVPRRPLKALKAWKLAASL